MKWISLIGDETGEPVLLDFATIGRIERGMTHDWKTGVKIGGRVYRITLDELAIHLNADTFTASI